jgi:hypothetical protein
MPWNVLLLPLVGGYSTLHFFYYSRFRAHRLEGHRLLLDSALVGLALITAARLFILLLKTTEFGRALRETWVSLAGETPYFGTALLSLILGLLVPLGLNIGLALLLRAESDRATSRRPLIRDFLTAANAKAGPRRGWRSLTARGALGLRGSMSWLRALIHWFLQPARDHSEDWAMRHMADPAYRQLRKAMQDGRPVMVSLRDRKVYVGLVWDLPEEREKRGFILLLPIISGYRESESLKVILTTPYPTDLYQQSPGQPQESSPEDFLINIPWDQIQNAHPFNPEVYEQHFKQQTA